MKQAMIPVMDAIVIVRVFGRIERQISDAWREERDQDACAMARMLGRLQVLIVGWENYGPTVLDEPRVEVAA